MYVERESALGCGSAAWQIEAAMCFSPSTADHSGSPHFMKTHLDHLLRLLHVLHQRAHVGKRVVAAAPLHAVVAQSFRPVVAQSFVQPDCLRRTTPSNRDARLEGRDS